MTLSEVEEKSKSQKVSKLQKWGTFKISEVEGIWIVSHSECDPGKEPLTLVLLSLYLSLI